MTFRINQNTSEYSSTLRSNSFLNTLIVFAILSMSFISCKSQNKEQTMAEPKIDKSNAVTLFLSGDVMTGRGIDQGLPHSVDPLLYESLS